MKAMIHALEDASITVALQYIQRNRTIQYNWSLISLFFLVNAKLRSAFSRLGGAEAIVMQSIVGEELAQGPYTWRPERDSNLRLSGRKEPNPTTEPPRPNCSNMNLTETSVFLRALDTRMQKHVIISFVVET